MMERTEGKSEEWGRIRRREREKQRGQMNGSGE